MRHRVFAYGTLLFPAIARAVTGEESLRLPARLDDHARHALRDRAYPGAVPRPGASIEGVVYDQLSPAALARIDEFEGELYRRHEVRVRVGTEGHAHAALIYLVRPRWRSLLLPRDWSPEHFRRDWHDRYLRTCAEQFPRDRQVRGPAANTRR